MNSVVFTRCALGRNRALLRVVPARRAAGSDSDRGPAQPLSQAQILKKARLVGHAEPTLHAIDGVYEHSKMLL